MYCTQVLMTIIVSPCGASCLSTVHVLSWRHSDNTWWRTGAESLHPTLWTPSSDRLALKLTSDETDHTAPVTTLRNNTRLSASTFLLPYTVRLDYTIRSRGSDPAVSTSRISHTAINLTA